MDYFRSLLGDPVPTVPQHNLVTCPESLRWCGFYLRTQGIKRTVELREYILTLGSSILCKIDQLLGSQIFSGRGNTFKKLIKALGCTINVLC